MSFDARLLQLGIELPRVPVPVANFVPWREENGLIYLAGQVCEWNGKVMYVGKVGVEHTLETGKAAARICGLNLIAALRSALGSLDRVRCCLRLGGFVNCDPQFLEVPQVINGASDLMHEIFGQHGAHARTAVGVAALPRGASVEVDAIFAVHS